jgi:hypothetical protein
MSGVTGARYGTLWTGTLGMLSFMIGMAQRFAPEPGATFPAWQGMEYSRDMFSGRGRLAPLDNDRYPGSRWTSVRERMAELRQAEAGQSTA